MFTASFATILFKQHMEFSRNISRSDVAFAQCKWTLNVAEDPE